MAEITPRRNGELLRTVFEILMIEPEGLQAKEVLARLEDKVKFSNFERGSYPSSPGTPRWHKILRFGTIPFVKPGIVRLVHTMPSMKFRPDGIGSRRVACA